MTEVPAAFARAGRWVTHPAWAQEDPPTVAPTLRARWSLGRAPASAELHVLALGVWTATLDGAPVSEDVLEPGVSDFDRRVALAGYDLTGRLGAGDHELILELGEGAAHVREAPGRYAKFTGLRVPPRARAVLRLVHEDGSEEVLASGPDWQARLGPTALSHWYGGEEYDARLEPDGWPQRSEAGDWVPVAVVGEPAEGPSPWCRQAPPMRVVERLDPVSVTPTERSLVVDFGRNIAGRQVLRAAELPAGTTVRMWPAEYLDEAGHVDQHSTGSPIQDAWTSAGRPSAWHPRFSYHGFQYLEVDLLRPDGTAARPDPQDVVFQAEVVHTDNRAVGELTLSDPVLSRIDTLVGRAVAGNMVSVPTDCPHREKLGWLEQLHLVFEPVAFRWDVAGHWRDMITHMVDAQTEEGLIPDTAPELVVFDFLDPGFRDDVNWGSAIWRVPEKLYRAYGDLEPARAAWEAGRRYLDYLEGQVVDGLLDAGLGDWITLDPTTPRALVATYGLVRAYDSAAFLAAALERDEERAAFRERAAELRARVLGAFAGVDTQAGRALLIDLGVLTAAEEAATARTLAEQVARDGHQVRIGEIALPALIRSLSRHGHDEVLYRMVTQAEGPGYGQMVADGLTALAEHWTGARTRKSANHFMLGYVSAWFIESLAGLRQHPESVAWARARVAPTPLAGLEHASAVHHSRAGTYRVEWRREGGTVLLDVEVPQRGAAEVCAPRGHALQAGGEDPRPGGETVADLGPGAHRLRFTRAS